LPLDQVVINTEAHPLPRFELGKLLKTGWKRKPRANGKLVGEAPQVETVHVEQVVSKTEG
jgi:endoplasmic reticulum Man9GlcNAc2 1,2-alpha-mannosidase